MLTHYQMVITVMMVAALSVGVVSLMKSREFINFSCLFLLLWAVVFYDCQRLYFCEEKRGKIPLKNPSQPSIRNIHCVNLFNV